MDLVKLNHVRVEVEEWKANNPDALQEYKGLLVAIHPKRGVVCFGEDDFSVIREVETMGLYNEVVFEGVTSPNIHSLNLNVKNILVVESYDFETITMDLTPSRAKAILGYPGNVSMCLHVPSGKSVNALRELGLMKSV